MQVKRRFEPSTLFQKNFQGVLWCAPELFGLLSLLFSRSLRKILDLQHFWVGGNSSSTETVMPNCGEDRGKLNFTGCCMVNHGEVPILTLQLFIIVNGNFMIDVVDRNIWTNKLNHHMQILPWVLDLLFWNHCYLRSASLPSSITNFCLTAWNFSRYRSWLSLAAINRAFTSLCNFICFHDSTVSQTMPYWDVAMNYGGPKKRAFCSSIFSARLLRPSTSILLIVMWSIWSIIRCRPVKTQPPSCQTRHSS